MRPLRLAAGCVLLGLGLVALAGLTSCGGGSGSSSFSDSLRFGTGIGGNGFELTGESDTFSVAALGASNTISFRLESAADMAGRAVRLHVNSVGTSGAEAPYWQKDYANPQSYGHILLSSFRVTDAGEYKVKAVLVKDVGGGIGDETHVVDAPLHMTP